MSKTYILRDTFRYKNVPFLVEVFDEEIFINAKTGEMKQENVRGNPVGLSKTPRHWVRCEARVCQIRPDYPYKMVSEWPRNATKHVTLCEPYERPTKGLFFYGTKEREQVEDDPRLMAKIAIGKLKDEYENGEPLRLS